MKNLKALLGKLQPDMLNRSVLRYTGARRDDLLVGGGLGEDAALIRFPRSDSDGAPFLVAAADPVVGASEGAGRLLVHINANDVACKGADPAWLIVTLIVPASEGAALIEKIMKEIHEACLDMDIAIAGGHTELTDRYDRPVIAGTMLGPSRCHLSVGAIQEGDEILVTGHAGLEGMSILAHDRPDLLACLDDKELEKVRSWSENLSVVPAAKILRDFARYMHDPTEGGLDGALQEICRARGLDVETDAEAVPVSPLTKRAAEALGFDPLHLISSGMLIAVVPPERSGAARAALLEKNIPPHVIGRFTAPRSPESKIKTNPDMHEELWGILSRSRGNN